MSKPFLTVDQAQKVAADPHGLAALIGIPYEAWANRCHEVSLALLKTGRFGPGRIARGMAEGVGSQHSWIVLSWDPYDDEATVVDPTIVPLLRQRGIAGTNDPEGLPDIMVEHAWKLSNQPHGKGSIWAFGRPQESAGNPVELTPSAELSKAARMFLSILGPLDHRGWMQLASQCPVGGWPAAEIIAAMDDTPELSALVPIDRLGMLTSRNPGGLYLNPEDKDDWP
jgi:hypothetical protein